MTRIRRRTVLETGCVLATALVAGCSGESGSEFRPTQGDDDDPFDADPEELLLPISRIEERLEEGWSVEGHEGEMFLDPDAERQYFPYDEAAGEFHTESGIVTSGVWRYDDVETARNEFADHPYQEGWGLEERSIAVESIGGVSDQHADARVVFRDANAVGGILYDNEHVDEAERAEIALDLAALMHRSWRPE